MYPRKVNDPVSPNSERLVSYMNTHPATILGYAKYYGEIRSAVSARMVEIDSNGFVVEVDDENGSKSEVHIKFKNRLRSYEEVRPTLTRMAQEAEDALGLPSTRPPPMFSGSSSQNLTSHTPFIIPGIADLLMSTFFIVFLLTIAFYPYSSPAIIEELREFFGQTAINLIVVIMICFHIVEAVIAYVVLITRGEEDTMTLVKWVVANLIYGHIWLLWKEQSSAKKKTN
ncbi:hypothetical protein RclHR1_02660023 [Rhizophagus clarus]|uniref:DUF2470 domain-containing protein n=1 Tax=Rhizophagus clarus TaxID=94130 RepID=A0A2Z6R585_9GLOM|nr:hypothetical protein RclHR1_02660023 [Rhizophagus clarus]GES77669.1 hypothetical protein RCL_jg12481.t1 [Rhizophagus clarus]